MSSRVTIEICTGDLESALAAGKGGADRVELCDNLEVGGTTPSAGTIAEACRRLAIPVHVLIRPRAGDFLPTAAELAAMSHDIAMARNLGASGAVLGLLRPDGTIDRERTASLIELARPMSVTFHKAFDQVRDHEEALDTLIALGVDRVLTSGCRPTAMDGIDTLRKLVDCAGGRITILAGGRITAENIEPILSSTGVREIHLGSAVARVMTSMMTHSPADRSELGWRGVDAEKVRGIIELVGRLSRSRQGQGAGEISAT
jgi:copper homeostasis protein